MPGLWVRASPGAETFVLSLFNLHLETWKPAPGDLEKAGAEQKSAALVPPRRWNRTTAPLGAYRFEACNPDHRVSSGHLTHNFCPFWILSRFSLSADKLRKSQRVGSWCTDKIEKAKLAIIGVWISNHLHVRCVKSSLCTSEAYYIFSSSTKKGRKWQGWRRRRRSKVGR